MHKTVVLDGGEALTRPVDGEISLVATMTAEVGIITEAGGDIPAYTGPTEITPTTSTQTLHTANKKVLTTIIINPIPNNYGLITWNGAVLTVS